MKLNRKFTISVTAALLAVAPVTGVVSLPKTNIVVSGKIKVTQTYASYFANGKRHPVKKGKVLQYYGTPKYKPFDPGSYYFGELQYNLGNSGLLSSDYVKQISGKIGSKSLTMTICIMQKESNYLLRLNVVKVQLILAKLNQLKTVNITFVNCNNKLNTFNQAA